MEFRSVRGAETAMGSVAESTADKQASWWMSYTQLIYEMEITARVRPPSTVLEGSGVPG
jgi:hypothetical protein